MDSSDNSIDSGHMTKRVDVYVNGATNVAIPVVAALREADDCRGGKDAADNRQEDPRDEPHSDVGTRVRALEKSATRAGESKA
ncbi:hypothetical protein ARSEF1564_007776 [Beauveria bassiana]